MTVIASYLSRVAGLLIISPSIGANISVLNLLAFTWSGTAAQSAMLFATLISMLTDVQVLITITWWLINPTWTLFTRMMVTFNVLKRVYSIVAVYIAYLRFQVVTSNFKVIRRSKSRSVYERWNLPAVLFTSIYCILAFVALYFHIYAYASQNWNGLLGRQTPEFTIYRIINTIATLMYAIIAIYIDMKLIHLGRTGTLGQQPSDTTARQSSLVVGLQRSRKYFNMWINIAYEFILLACYIAAVVWFFLDLDMIGSSYIEQGLLSYLTLNGFTVVQAILKDTGEDTVDEKTGGTGWTAGNSDRFTLGSGTVGSTEHMSSLDRYASGGKGSSTRSFNGGGHDVQVIEYPSGAMMPDVPSTVVHPSWIASHPSSGV